MPRALSFYGFYPGDYRADTRHLNRAQHFAYREIMDEIFMSGQERDPPSIPDDDDFLAELCRAESPAEWATTRRVLIDGPRALLQRENGRISQRRMTAEIEKALGLSEKRREAAAKRWRGRTETGRHDANEAQDVPTVPENDGGPFPRATGPIELPADGIGAIEIITRTIRAVAPAAELPDDFEVSRWLRDFHSDPWWIAAAICEASASLAGKQRAVPYLRSVVQQYASAGAKLDDPKGYVTYFTSPERLAKLGTMQ